MPGLRRVLPRMACPHPYSLKLYFRSNIPAQTNTSKYEGERKTGQPIFPPAVARMWEI